MGLKKKLLAVFCCLLGITTCTSCVNFPISSQREETTMEMTLTLPNGEAVPYIQPALEYLQAGAGANVRQYMVSVDNPNQAIQVTWSCTGGSVATYKVEYATKADYSDAIVKTCDGDTDFVELYNLYKGTEYLVRVTAQDENGKALAMETGTFTTTNIGPRVMQIPDIHNVRDIGGYQTVNGQATEQDLVYRGGTLRPADIYTSNLTVEGARYMRNVMGIKTEIDFRGSQEAGGITESVIPGAKLRYAPLGGYADAFAGSEGYRKTFEILADKNNYPIYYHCTGGADRTGTVTFLLNALLGVAETELIQDYEFTTFSVYGERNTQQGVYANYFKEFRKGLDAYAGETLQEKVESYLLSIGVTKLQLESIQAIMCGGIAD